jgi:hypothetical protein
MKTNLIFACFFFTACQSAPPVVRPLPDPLPLRTQPENLAGRTVPSDGPAVAATRETPPAVDAEKLTRQRQWIEALMAQNDALAARLEALKHDAASTAPQPAAPKSPAPAKMPKPEAAPPPPAAPVSSAAPAASAVVAQPAAEAPSAPTPLLMPNADGVIDTTVLSAPGNPPNPFAVRTLSADAVREVTFVVDGIFQGDSPCALVNGRVAEVGDLVESLRLTKITPAALTLTGDGFAINLPLGATKVRLAL